MKDWNQIFTEKGVIHKDPDKDLIKIIPLLKKYNVKKILDVGCGMGRHLLILKNEGFEVYGCDISKKAIKSSSEIIDKKRLKLSDMSNLEYKDNSFDCIISIAVIQHGKISKIKKAISEIFRILKKGGVIFINTISDKDFSFRTGKEIEPNTRIGTEQLDGNITHHFFSENEIKELFSDFEIISLEHNRRKSIQMPSRIRSAWILFARKK
ncbi:methyltransferase domain-containing protein [Candidatus Woesearchaeota archaeon]|nr:methyltransferase domain-containing protein [Candidatus Woesearchaeota archaeon]